LGAKPVLNPKFREILGNSKKLGGQPKVPQWPRANKKVEKTRHPRKPLVAQDYAVQWTRLNLENPP